MNINFSRQSIVLCLGILALTTACAPDEPARMMNKRSLPFGLSFQLYSLESKYLQLEVFYKTERTDGSSMVAWGTNGQVTSKKVTLEAREVAEVQAFFTAAKIAEYKSDPSSTESSPEYPRASIDHRTPESGSNVFLMFRGMPNGEAAQLIDYLTRLSEKAKAQ